jgi:hypothetical protein
MPIKYLTTEQHVQVLQRLAELARKNKTIPSHPNGWEYTSLMACFLMHQACAGEALLRLAKSFGKDWFPSTVAYAIVRPMFEIDVTAHYLTQDPVKRARQYIDFGCILEKQEMEACQKHRNSTNPTWPEAMRTEWDHHWAPIKKEVDSDYDRVAPRYQRPKKGGGVTKFRTWSGMSLREMAVAVKHEEAYDVFYARLSSFTHADVHLADRFLRTKPELRWSARAEEFDVASIFKYADVFLTCFLELFGEQFACWSKTDVDACWNVPAIDNHPA